MQVLEQCIMKRKYQKLEWSIVLHRKQGKAEDVKSAAILDASERSISGTIVTRNAREMFDRRIETRALIRSAKQGRKMNFVEIIGLDRMTLSFTLTWKCVHSEVTFSIGKCMTRKAALFYAQSIIEKEYTHNSVCKPTQARHHFTY